MQQALVCGVTWRYKRLCFAFHRIVLLDDSTQHQMYLVSKTFMLTNYKQVSCPDWKLQWFPMWVQSAREIRHVSVQARFEQNAYLRSRKKRGNWFFTKTATFLFDSVVFIGSAAVRRRHRGFQRWLKRCANGSKRQYGETFARVKNFSIVSADFFRSLDVGERQLVIKDRLT